ncbi:MAG: hypothetical protein ACK5XN_18700, partial [Bacteroidota bacterium]
MIFYSINLILKCSFYNNNHKTKSNYSLSPKHFDLEVNNPLNLSPKHFDLESEKKNLLNLSPKHFDLEVNNPL